MTTLEGILTAAEALPLEEQWMLEELLRGRRIETWRRETAAEAKEAERAFSSGELRSQPVEAILTRLRDSTP